MGAVLYCLWMDMPSQGFSGKLMIHRFLGKTKKRGSALPGLVAWICVTPRYLRRTQKRDLTYKIDVDQLEDALYWPNML